ncbi:hypothetical protein BKA70DRAFT_1102530 [Coprinopsis sp. MPI-PUGE-AT-0042]|nr:hypothetical protein BKA70DRAFT_1102530 [Coprinopsis sp. MPI-PUGE-AT-0042]
MVALLCLDGHMNIALEKVEEYVNRKILNRYGNAFVQRNRKKPGCVAVVFFSHNLADLCRLQSIIHYRQAITRYTLK